MPISTTMIVIGVAAAALVATPFALPSSKTVERSATIQAEPEALYEMIAEPRNFQTFNPYRDTDADLKITFFGPETGIGSGFAFEGKEGKGTQTVTRLEDNRLVQMEIDLGPMGKPIQTFTLEPADNGTKVIWSTHSDFGMNPIGRVFGLFLDGMLGKIYERGLNNMAKNVTAST